MTVPLEIALLKAPLSKPLGVSLNFYVWVTLTRQSHLDEGDADSLVSQLGNGEGAIGVKGDILVSAVHLVNSVLFLLTRAFPPSI